MTDGNEDVDYTVDDFATPDKEPESDEDQPNKSVLRDVLKELKRDIAINNSFTSVNLPENATPEEKSAAFDQMAINKGLALHLEKYKVLISNKLKELK